MSQFFNKTRLNAVAALSLFFVAFIYFGPKGTFEFSDVNNLLGAVTEIIWSVYVVFLIYKMRGHDDSDRLGVWGYLWRGLVTKYLCMMFVVMFLLLFRFAVDGPSVEYTLAFSVVNFLATLGAAWLLFSNDRRAHFAWFMQIFRGY